MEEKHATQWIIDEHPSGCTVIRDAESGHDIASVFCTDMPFGAAHAKLLRAAPSLLAALERTNEALAMMHPDNGDHDGLEYCKCKLAKQWRSARAALAEARS